MEHNISLKLRINFFEIIKNNDNILQYNNFNFDYNSLNISLF